jgi:hypothetical protein
LLNDRNIDMYCSKCGTSLAKDAQFCNGCGLKLSEIAETQLPRKATPIADLGQSVSCLVKHESVFSPNDTASAIHTPEEVAPHHAKIEVPNNSVAQYVSMQNTAVFVIAYLLCMLPTYYLPWMGSNSSAVQGFSSALGGRLSALLWLHISFLVGLMAITFCRAPYIGKLWLPTLPAVAMFFDLVPGMSSIPLVPTVLHIMALFCGASGVINIDYRAGFKRAIGSASVVLLCLVISMAKFSGMGSISNQGSNRAEGKANKTSLSTNLGQVFPASSPPVIRATVPVTCSH